MIYIAAGTLYQSIWFGAPEIEWYSISFGFQDAAAFSAYRFQIIKNYPPTLFECMYKTREAAPFLSVSAFYRLLDDIYRKMTKTAHSDAALTVAPAIRYLEENYQQALSVKSLADLCHISESGFFKAFQKATHVTPIQYKHNIMVQNAISLLANTTLSIEEISAQVGFSSANYFRKVFFKITRKTPKEVRK